MPTSFAKRTRGISNAREEETPATPQGKHVNLFTF
jgi:hypothetical protein